MLACRYCGFVANRASDDDCPARLINRVRNFLRTLCEKVHS